MHRTRLNLVVVLAVLACVGAVRMPLEHALSNELREKQILAPSFDLEARAGLSQKGFVVSFGSLRPTLAALYALSGSNHHRRSDWEAIEDTYETVVLLDPYNEYYWDLGGWHLAYNAASSSREDSSIPPLQRQRLADSYVQKGERFYDRGILANPQSYDLRMAKARLWSRPTVEPDYTKVADTLAQALDELELPHRLEQRVQRNLFYALLRVPERVQEAYQLGRELYRLPENRVPSLLNGLCALQMHPRVEVAEALSLEELYGSRENARKLLENYYGVEDAYKPMYGVRELLESLR